MGLTNTRVSLAIVAIVYSGISLVTPTAANSTERPCKSAVSSHDTAEVLASADIEALLAAAARLQASSPKSDLLKGIAASYVLNDEEARLRLKRYVSRSGRPFLFQAGTTLAGAEMRLGRYADAANTLRAALAADRIAGVRPDDIRPAKDTLKVAEVLRGVPRQSGPAATSGEIAIARDAAGLALGELLLNGQSQRAIIDTGANLSVVIRSKAESLGMRILPGSVSIASPVSSETPAQLAVADRLVIGGAEFRNVVFIVFPDEALSFAGGAYKIEAILGFPVLVELGRIQFSGEGAGERMNFARPTTRPPVAPSTANLFVENLTPKIIACSVPERIAVQFALDSGADRTSLRPLFGSTFPSRVQNAKVTTSNQGGAGGIVKRDKSIVPSVDFEFDGTQLNLRDLGMSEETLNEPGDHARLGQDILRAKGGYVLDFTRMRFSLGSAASR